MAERSGLGWRVITAAVLIPFVLATTFWLPPVSLLVLAVVAAFCTGWEAMAIAAPCPAVIDGPERALGAALAAAVCVGATWAAVRMPVALAAAFPAVFLVVMVVLVLRPREIATFSARATAMAFVPLYLGLGLATLPVFRYIRPDTGGRWVILTMTIAFGADTTAYFGGRFLGRHRLHERVSPKKTWEGSIAGLLGSAGAVALAVAWYLPELEWVDVAVLAPVAGTLGQFGDLFESALKRSVGVKDSGTLLPGHGGLFDRIDALLPTALVVFAYAWFRGHLAFGPQ